MDLRLVLEKKNHELKLIGTTTHPALTDLAGCAHHAHLVPLLQASGPVKGHTTKFSQGGMGGRLKSLTLTRNRDISEENPGISGQGLPILGGIFKVRNLI